MVIKFHNIKAVIFDLDWTLVNSTIDFDEMKRSILGYLTSVGINDPSLSEMRVFELTKIASSLEIGVQKTINKIINQVEIRKADETKPISGVKDILRELRSRGIKIGVLTRGHGAYAHKALKVTGLCPFIDLIIARDQTERPKPDPHHLSHAMGILQITREETLMVGDSLLDARCARSAEVAFLGVLGGVSSHQDFKDFGCEIMSTIKDLTKVIS